MKKATHSSNWDRVSEIELVYRSKVKASERPKIQSSSDAYEIVLASWDPGKIEFFEQFKIVLLNQAYRVLGIYELSSGGITGTVVDVRLVFSAALKANATALMMVHNHPSGNLTASEADRNITRKVKEAGRLLDIALVDSMIITPEGYCSFAAEGLL